MSAPPTDLVTLSPAELDRLPRLVVDRSAHYATHAVGPANGNGHRAPDAVPPRLLTRGRQTAPAWEGQSNLFGWKTIPRRQYARFDVGSFDLSKYQPYQVIEILAEVSPDVSQALWNLLLLTNSDYDIAVLDHNEKPDEQGQQLIDALLARLNPRSGGLDGLIDQWHYTAYLQGAMAAEIVLSPNLQDVEDIYAIAPWTIEFVREEPYPRPQQKLPWESKPRELNETTFRYLPVLPGVDDPYGRMPFASVLYALYFDLSLLRDLQVAVHANAWDKLDITVVEEAALATADEATKRNPAAARAWVNQVIDQVRTAFDGMRPDDHFIHGDALDVKPVTSGNRSVGIVPVFRLLERRIFRGLKQLPILMGSNEGTTETHGTIQWEIYVDGIQMVQHRTKHLLESMLTLALQVYGRQSHVEMTWDDIRVTDRKQDADAEAQEIRNAANKRDQGWITQEQASIEVTGEQPAAKTPIAFQPSTGGMWRWQPADAPEQDDAP